MLFRNFKDYSIDRLLEYGQRVGLSDLDDFKQRLTSAEVLNRLRSEAREAARAGVRGTPTVFVNRRRMESPEIRTLDDMIVVLREVIGELKQQPQ